MTAVDGRTQLSGENVSAILPRKGWASSTSERTALVVHGLGSSADTAWQLCERLAAAGYAATAVDLRGHGAAPRTSTYRMQDFAGDLSLVHPDTPASDTWDLVVGHSIGAVASMIASANNRSWASRVVLLDPLLVADQQMKDRIIAMQRTAHLEATTDSVAAANPAWHELDVELSVRAVRGASPHALEHAISDTVDWDFFPVLPAVEVPALLVGGDATRGALFTAQWEERLRDTGPNWAFARLPETGHNLHRDAPGALLEVVLEWCGATDAYVKQEQPRTAGRHE